MADLAKTMYPDGPSTILGNQLAEEGKAKSPTFSGNWWMDPNLDWNTVPVGKHHDFSGELSMDIYNSARDKISKGMEISEAYKELNNKTEALIQKYKLKPGDLFSTKEPMGPKTYMYMGPGHPKGQNFFLWTPPTPSPGVV